MALNWTILAPDAFTPLSLPDERVYTEFKDVRMELESGNGFPGAGGVSYFVKRGKVVLSSHRLVYLSSAWLEWSRLQVLAASESLSQSIPQPTQPFVGFQSLSVPLRNIQELKYNQPWLGSNHVHFNAVPVPEGGLVHMSSVKLYFDLGGGFECYSQLCTILERALIPNFSPSIPNSIPVDEPLPLYIGSEPSSSTSQALPCNNIHVGNNQDQLPGYDAESTHPFRSSYPNEKSSNA